mgnify:CR=1 FL=1
MFVPYSNLQIISDLRQFCDTLWPLDELRVEHKSDASLVTEIDHKISQYLKTHISCQGLTFYSEEDHSQLVFPAAILDPIDGTRELVKLRGECAVSLARMRSPKLSEGEALVYNPFTGFAAHSDQRPPWRARFHADELLGLVSRSEWEQGLFAGSTERLRLVPRGSIAFKLGLLAAGACDYVVSLRPKNIWDIAAGTILCEHAGISFLAQGTVVRELSQPTYPAPLIWARPELMPSLRAHFSS